MNKTDQVISALTDDFMFDALGIIKLTREAAQCIVERLKEQQADIERLNTENKRVSDRLRIMFNRCICFRGSDNCDECAQREECESKRVMYKGWYLKDRKRVEKDTNGEEVNQ